MRAATGTCATTACRRPGPFPQSKGSLLKHDKLIDFIQRNYECDEQGQWFFQNGPQRVYVELEATPWVWRARRGRQRGGAHRAAGAGRSAAVLDEQGRLYLETDLGFGLVHTLDVAQAADAIEQGLWAPEEMTAGELPQRFGYVPAARAMKKPARAGFHERARLT